MPRKDPRYRELRSFEEQWIKVTFVQLFSPRKEFHGFLYDLTAQAVRVLVPTEHRADLEGYLQKGALIRFRIDAEKPITVSTAYLMRIDDMTPYLGAVLKFDAMREEERDAIAVLCDAFEKRHGRT